MLHFRCVHVSANVWREAGVKPGVKQRPIHQGAVVVVSDVVGHLHLPGADGGRVVGLDLDAVLRVPDIEEQDVKVEGGIRRDEFTCGGEMAGVLSLIMCRNVVGGGREGGRERRSGPEPGRTTFRAN